MPDRDDFERVWLRKLAHGLQEVDGESTRRQVMAGSETLSSDSPQDEVISWTRTAMERLVSTVNDRKRKAIMTTCACGYPKAALQDVRRAYDSSAADVDLALHMLQRQFEAFLTDTLKLEARLVREITARGWGLAGVRQGNTIVVTKIPKSGHLVEYLETADPMRRRQLYCHCPRIRDVLSRTDLEWPRQLAETYCTCGAGFYKGIWEEIVQAPVTVEIVESVLMGDEVCRVAINLPPLDS